MADNTKTDKKKKEESSWLRSFVERLDLGTGAAENARQKLSSRQAQIDALLSEATGTPVTSLDKDKKKKNK